MRRRKDGRLIDIDLTVSPVRDGNGTIIGASKIARDITERKQTKRAMAEAQEAGNNPESIGDAVLATDTESRISYLNPVAERLLGCSIAETIGQPLDKFFTIVNAETRQTVALLSSGSCAKGRLPAWRITRSCCVGMGQKFPSMTSRPQLRMRMAGCSEWCSSSETYPTDIRLRGRRYCSPRSWLLQTMPS